MSGAVPQGDDHHSAQDFIGEPPLDTAQQLRIRATHRGFTYQNLYAVGCLLRLRDAGAESLLVERDEDLEVVLPGRRLYLQVKTRKSGVLVWSDIRNAVDQYREVRAEHDADRRSGSPALIVITNAKPGPDLLDRTLAVDWPGDVHLLYPGMPSEAEAWLPTPAPDLEAMMQWCTAEAGKVRFASLKPQTLVEKLAARVQYASTGALGQGFVAADLGQLFEQFVQELQAFPEAPDTYRAQRTDPELVGEQRVRLVVGYSGAGKTTWAADAATRCSLPVTYCDVADGVSAEALAESVARELAARHLSGSAGTELPYGSGLDVLRAVHLRLEEAGTIVAVVLDNAHRLPVDGLRAIIAALPSAQLVLLAHPWPDLPVLEAHLGITPQVLPGWTVDTVVQVFADEGCRTDYATAQRVITLTGGLPLYVGQAAVLARSQYGADVAAFCDAFGEGTHATPTAQERILERAFAGLGETARALAGLLALAEVPLKRDELQQLAAEVGLGNRPVNSRALRELVGPGLTQSFGDGHLKLHDAARSVATAVLEALDEETADRVQRVLCQIVEGDWDPARRSRWIRLLGSTGQIELLIALTEEEGFFERDYPRQVHDDLTDAALDPASDPALRLDAHNALSAWAFRERDMEAFAWHVQAMETIHRAGHPAFGPREAVLVASRQFRLYGPAGSLAQLRRAFAEAITQTPV
ncbi:AAA family ATPase, partial [Kitasatospora sp. NPDC058263]